MSGVTIDVGAVEFERLVRRLNSRRRTMVGFITEQHLKQADEAFPGIARFFDGLLVKPKTFLELVCAFEHWAESSASLGDLRATVTGSVR